MKMTRYVVNQRTVQTSRSVMDVEIAASVSMHSTILGLPVVMDGEEETTLRSHIAASMVREHVLSFSFS